MARHYESQRYRLFSASNRYSRLSRCRSALRLKYKRCPIASQQIRIEVHRKLAILYIFAMFPCFPSELCACVVFHSSRTAHHRDHLVSPLRPSVSVSACLYSATAATVRVCKGYVLIFIARQSSLHSQLSSPTMSGRLVVRVRLSICDLHQEGGNVSANQSTDRTSVWYVLPLPCRPNRRPVPSLVLRFPFVNNGCVVY